MDFIRDPLWQFVGAILGILAIIVTIILFFIQRRKKSLTYEIISRTSVLSASDEVSGKLQILYQGEAVRKVNLLVLKLANTGNVPITTLDYEREVSFIFTDCEKILSAELSEVQPTNLAAEIVTKEKSVSLKPILLNPGDSIILKLLISGFDNKIEIDGRVVGVKSISKRTDSNSWSFLLMLAGIIMASIGIVPNFDKPSDQMSPIMIVLLVVGYVLMLTGLLTNKRGKKIIDNYFDLFRRIFG